MTLLFIQTPQIIVQSIYCLCSLTGSVKGTDSPLRKGFLMSRCTLVCILKNATRCSRTSGVFLTWKIVCLDMLQLWNLFHSSLYFADHHTISPLKHNLHYHCVPLRNTTDLHSIRVLLLLFCIDYFISVCFIK